MNRWKLVAIAVAAGWMHFLATFVAWALADARPPANVVLPWRVLSFPVFYAFGGNFADIWFYETLAINSVMWGAAFGLVLFLIARKRGRTPKGRPPATPNLHQPIE